jgi:hypothetical protein
VSAPPIKRHAYDASQEAELARWPGVTWHREHRGKHCALVLQFADQSRFVIYPATPGDSRRGALNHLRDIRSVLCEIGASREAEARRSQVQTRRHKPSHRIEPIRIRAQDSTRLGQNPFAALAGLKIPPRRVTVRQIALRYFVRAAA